MDYLIERLKEKSTWRGMVAIATALGVTVSPELTEAIIAIGLALIGVINVVRAEKK